MWTSGFFNSVNGDRRYNADQMSAIFDGLITNGVYESVGNKLAVEPNSGMTIQINTGRGWFNGRWVNNDTLYLQTLQAPDVLLNRYCAVCIRVDLTESNRKAEPYLKYGELATAPLKPTMERSETVKEYCLAYVYIRGGAVEITAADIEDTRSNGELCGWVTGLIKQLDNNTLYKQWEAIFFDWFNNLESYLDENVEAKLVNDVTKLSADVVALERDVSQLCNPNILINGDFQVWQRGTSFNGACYSADRWFLYAGHVERSENKKMKLVFNSDYAYDVNSNKIIQFIDADLNDSKYMLSCKIDGNVHTIPLSLNKSMTEVVIDKDKFKISLGWTDRNCYALGIQVKNGMTIEIEWIKLEQGTIATPFVPRLFAEELAICRRYYIADYRFVIPLVVGQNSQFMIPPMRQTPTVTFNNGWYKNGTTGVQYDKTKLSVTGHVYNAISIGIVDTTLTNMWWSFINVNLDAEIY